MLSHSQTPEIRKSFCQTANYYISKFFYGITSIAASIPNSQYAATFSYNASAPALSPSQVSYTSFVNLSAASKFGFVKNALGTIVVSSAFMIKHFGLASKKISDEFSLFRQCKNTKRFLTVISLSFFSALTGGSISGGPYSGALQWVARFLGFSTNGALSFLGLCELITTLTDKDYAFRLKIIDHLKRLDPKYLKYTNEMLNGKELTSETLKEFLTNLANLANQYQADIEARKSGDVIAPLFIEKSDIQIAKERNYKAADYVCSGVLTFFVSTLYMQSGFGGMCILANNDFGMLNNASKIVISIPSALPSVAFVFFTVKFFNSSFVAKYSEIRSSTNNIIKAALLLAACESNATWFFGLMKSIINSDNIFPFLLNTDFGRAVFPWAAYLTAFNMGFNALVPMVFPTKINFHQPTLDDVINGLENNVFPATILQGLQNHTFFVKPVKPKNEGLMIELEAQEKVESKMAPRTGLEPVTH